MTDTAATDAFVTGESAHPSDHESSATPFHDASRAVGERTLDLLGRMSVEEKAAQLASPFVAIVDASVPPPTDWGKRDCCDLVAEGAALDPIPAAGPASPETLRPAGDLADALQPTHPTTRSTRGGAARHSLPPLAHPGRSN